MCDYIKTILVHDVVVEGSKLNKNINDTIASILKLNVEEKCLDKGYIKKGSVEVIKRGVGVFSGSLFNGSVKYRVVYSCELCNPSKGDSIKCKVINVNELGLRGVAGPIRVIVAKQFQDNVKVFKNIKQGDEVEVVILDKKFDLNSPYIEVAAKINEEEIFKGLNKKIDVVETKMDKPKKKFVLSSLEELDVDNVDINEIAEELDISDSEELDEMYGTDESEVEEEELEQDEKVLAYENITGKNNVNLQTTSIDIEGENPNEQEVEAEEESDEDNESDEEESNEANESEEEDIMKDEDEEDSDEELMDDEDIDFEDEEVGEDDEYYTD